MMPDAAADAPRAVARPEAPAPLASQALGAPGLAAGPLADLLMTIGAIILLLAAVLIARATPPEPAERFQPVLIADRDGVRLGPDGALAPLDTILTDQALAAVLREAGVAGDTPLLVIAPDGREAAFLLDVRAAEAGLSRLATVRLSQDCADRSGRWQRLCQTLRGGGSR